MAKIGKEKKQLIRVNIYIYAYTCVYMKTLKWKFNKLISYTVNKWAA